MPFEKELAELQERKEKALQMEGRKKLISNMTRAS